MDTAADIIRPFTREDAAGVAALFNTVMRRTDAAPSSALTGYFRSHFCDGPFADASIPSLVHISYAGTIDGFIGIATQPMTLGDRPLRAAILGTLMVRDHEKAPLAGARLLKRAASGPQDLTLSETAGDASLAMWRHLKATVLDRHSLDFIRVLQPAAFGLHMLSRRVDAAHLLSPLARLLDRRARGRSEAIRWTGLPAGFRAHAGIAAHPVDIDAFMQIAGEIWSQQAIIPAWPGDSLRHVIAEAMDKPAHGTAHLCAVTARTGKPIGGFLLHAAENAPARLVDILHRPGQAGPVLDALFAHAQTLGASAVQGRTTPALLDALLSRRTLFAHESASVIATADPAIMAAFSEGRAHFNGLVGERWTRMIGGLPA